MNYLKDPRILKDVLIRLAGIGGSDAEDAALVAKVEELLSKITVTQILVGFSEYFSLLVLTDLVMKHYPEEKELIAYSRKREKLFWLLNGDEGRLYTMPKEEFLADVLKMWKKTKDGKNKFRRINWNRKSYEVSSLQELLS